MSVIALKARWVLPIDTPPVEGGVVTVNGDRIAAVGSTAVDNAPVEDLGEALLLPGFVNAHTHLEFSHMSHPLGEPSLPLPEWIRLIIASRKQNTDSTLSVEKGIYESLRSGVTTLGDIVTDELPISKNSLPEMIGFHEVIGFSAARSESVYADLADRLRVSGSGFGRGISPHAPYTVHPNLLERLVELACERSLPVAMHLAESLEELELLRENAGPFRQLLEERSMWDNAVFSAGLTPQDYLRVLARAPRSLVIHGNYLDAAELDFLAARRDHMALVYCPRTHAYFGHEPYPLQAALEKGVRLAIGTDSRASNPDLSLLGELQSVAGIHQNLSPASILSLGTLSGAQALGLDHAVGSLEAGKLANLTALSFESAGAAPEETILYTRAIGQRTWLRGVEQFSLP